MRLTIHQPNYFPYPGFFHKLTLADTFVILDNVQYQYEHTNRNKILTRSGNWTRITVPTKKEHKFSLIRDVEINNAVIWRKTNWEQIFDSYHDAPFFNLYGDYLEQLYKQKWEKLFDINFEIIKKILELLDIQINIVLSSELNVSGNTTERLVNICKKLNADTYISGIGGKSYLHEQLFVDNNISLEYQRYSPTIYRQHLSKSFIPNLSILDLLMNLGPQSLQIINNSN